MEKPIYKYATFWGVLGGTALAYLYIKTLGKDKNITLNNALLIGGAFGAGIGFGIDLSINSKPKFFTEEELLQRASDLGFNTESEIKSYFELMKAAKLSEEDNQRIMRVIDAELKAKKDGKWDSASNLRTKKSVLMSYGITESDFDVFQTLVVTGFANIIVNAFNKGDNKS